MKHTPQYKETMFGWAWVCSCGAKEGFPPFVRKEHATESFINHKRRAIRAALRKGREAE